ncbi:carboxylate--amine ligase [Macrococcus animalis]|uniref:carboxylate--amine ligase n=1 Tax=Macrococcus animalis TaxID=3395467 RepID=UPI0039BE8556
MAKLNFIPIILGANIHAYAAATSFHKDYKKKSVIVAADYLSFTKFSSLISDYYIDKMIYDDQIFIDMFEKIAKKHGKKNRKLLLIATTDEYVKLLIKHEAKLRENYTFNFPTQELFNSLYYKKHFYETVASYGLDIPTTYHFNLTSIEEFNEPIRFPAIIKVDDGTAYFNLKFKGKQKIYVLNDYEGINQTIALLHNNGYREDIIIQEFIEGNDQDLWDIVYYGDSNGNAQVITLAQVLLQEPAMTAIGNYTALISRYDKELMDKVIKMMEALNYTGFANFDLKYDHRDGKYKFFEVNLRAGRSSSYVKETGYSIARCYVEDLILNQPHPVKYLDTTHLFTVVPKDIILKYVKQKALRKEIKQLMYKHHYYNPLYYTRDRSLKRKAYLLMRNAKYHLKYKNSQWYKDQK